jgi:hypothetical protein
MTASMDTVQTPSRRRRGIGPIGGIETAPRPELADLVDGMKRGVGLLAREHRGHRGGEGEQRAQTSSRSRFGAAGPRRKGWFEHSGPLARTVRFHASVNCASSCRFSGES